MAFWIAGAAADLASAMAFCRSGLFSTAALALSIASVKKFFMR